ncbi:MAG: hypothetical protein HFJ25_02180 [Clostridia bacterium]|jgi:hypothetical protein|nr:hypothetical protein [Clostridia bacterium]
MRILDEFDDREIELLENIGVEIRDREYNDFEIADIGDQVMDAVMNNLNDEGDFTELAEEYNWIHDKLQELGNESLYTSEDIVIKDWFNQEQIELLQENDVDLDRTYNASELEQLEDLVYNIMMSNMDENGDYTEIAEKYEKIIDVIVKIENEM